MYTPSLSIIAQRTAMDCAVACLAMLCGVEYEVALAAFRHNVSARGATIRQLQQAARRLKTTLVWSRRRVDVETETGLLCVRSAQWPNDHLVVLKEGQIIDTDWTLWDADVFLAAYKAKPISFLTFKEGEEC